MVWNILSLCADIFVLTGSILQVGGKFWLRHLRRESRKEEFRLRMPAGMKDIDHSVSRDNFDIYSFLLIGVGSIYFILNDLGLSSTSNLLLASGLAESTVFLVIGFSSCSVQAENDVEVYRWRTWPVYIKVYLGGVIGILLMLFYLAIAIAWGALDWTTTFPLLIISAILTFYLAKSLDAKTLHMKPER